MIVGGKLSGEHLNCQLRNHSNNANLLVYHVMRLFFFLILASGLYQTRSALHRKAAGI